MAYPGDFYPPHWGPSYQANSNLVVPHFNPSAPSIPSSRLGLQRHQPRNADDLSMKEMQRWIVETNTQQFTNMARLDRRTNENTQIMKGLEEIFRRDLRYLQRQIQDFTNSGPETPTRYYHFGHDLTPPSEMLETFNKRDIAMEYLKEAEEKEKIALELRKQADFLFGRHGTPEESATPPKMLEAPPTPCEKVVGFACCKTAFASVDELVGHVENSHCQDTTKNGKTNPGKRHATQARTTNMRKSAEGRPAFHQGFRMPVTVRNFAPFTTPIPSEHTETFSWEFLKHTFNGNQWQPGYYFVAGESALPSKSYYVIEADHEPYLPSAPGQHGAKLSPFFNDTPSIAGYAPDPEHFMDVPLFVREKNGKEYRYYGNYSQSRFSDKVDYDHLFQNIPDHVKKYWASQLADSGRPEWVTEKLMAQFWNRPTYCGRIPKERSSERRVQKALNEYADELKNWTEEARLKVNLLTEDVLYKSFSKADLDVEPGLRLWWEYLECVKYDERFYHSLVKTKKHDPQSFFANDADMSAPYISGKLGEGQKKSPATPASSSSTCRPDSIAAAQEQAAAVKLAKVRKAAEMKKAEEAARKRTIFSAPSFSPGTTHSSSSDMPANRMPIQSPLIPDTKTEAPKDKPLEATANDGNAWDEVGDMNAAEHSENEDMQEQHNRGRKSKSGAVVPPHLRKT